MMIGQCVRECMIAFSIAKADPFRSYFGGYAT
jgi:hypothetical protein